MAVLDLNCDLGESFGIWTLGDDEAMLDVVSSANVACGFHAGDPSTLRGVCEAAAARGVAIGAQVSYPDLVGFGRRAMDMHPGELRDAVLYQIGGLDAFAQAAGSEVTYVKPHGALYHAAADDPAAAAAVVAAAGEFRPGLAILGQHRSELHRAAAEAGMPTVNEAFADRAYLPDGRLVPRTQEGAVVTDVMAVADRVRRMAVDREVVAIDDSVVRLRVDSVCVHGDTPGAVAIARAVRSELAQAGVEVRRFAG
jgi:UPF0271 protein